MRKYFRFIAENDWNFSVTAWKQNNFTIKFGSHVDPLAYLFRFKDQPDEMYQNLAENSMQRKMIESITDFYVNFAKFG